MNHRAAAFRHHQIARFLGAGRAEERKQLDGADLAVAKFTQPFIGNRSLHAVRRQRPIQGDGEGKRFRRFLLIFLRSPQRLHFLVIRHGEARFPGIRVDLLSVARGYALGFDFIQAGFLAEHIGFGCLLPSRFRNDGKPFRGQLIRHQHDPFVGEAVDYADAIVDGFIRYLTVGYGLGIGTPGRAFLGVAVQIAEDELAFQVFQVSRLCHGILVAVLGVGKDHLAALLVQYRDFRRGLLQIQGHGVVFRGKNEARHSLHFVLKRNEFAPLGIGTGRLGNGFIPGIIPEMDHIPADHTANRQHNHGKRDPDDPFYAGREPYCFFCIFHASVPPFKSGKSIRCRCF